MAESVTKEELMNYCRIDDSTLGDTAVMIADAVEEELFSIGVTYDSTSRLAPIVKLMVMTLVAQRIDDPAGKEEVKETSALYRRYSQLFTNSNLPEEE